MFAYRAAITTADALAVVNFVCIHLAEIYTGTASCAAMWIYFYTKQGNFIKQGVNRAQRTKKAAKRAKDKDTGKQDAPKPN